MIARKSGVGMFTGEQMSGRKGIHSLTPSFRAARQSSKALFKSHRSAVGAQVQASPSKEYEQLSGGFCECAHGGFPCMVDM